VADNLRALRLFRVEKERMTVSWTTMLLAVSGMSAALAQGISGYEPMDAACVELNQTAAAQITNGQFALAESLLSTALSSGLDRSGDSCAGVVLNNMAALLSIQGRIAEAERFAERSVHILEARYPPDALVLLRPLSVLASVRFEQGKLGGAREAFKRMQIIRTETPADRALVHATAAVLLDAEGRLADAEAEYLATFHAWEEAGKAETAEAGAIFNSLGALYVKENRLDEARRALDRALMIFNRAKDAVPTDRIKAHHVRGVLSARQGAWQEAEQELSEALAMADREPWVEPAALRSLLISYGYVLRRNHHRREARAVEARAAGMQRGSTRSEIVDVTELLAKPKPAKK
jgi:tetratricopeptide (TPR) repeat protein